MKNKIVKTNSPAPPVALNLPAIVVTLLVGITAASLVGAQFHFANDPASGQFSLVNLDQRVTVLKEIADPVKRDQLCVPLSAYGRALDRALPTNARVFVTDMIGETNDDHLGYYFFLRNYLFPRDVEISLNDHATYHDWFDGVPCDSPAILQTNGFDLEIYFSDNHMQLIPLTTNGIPKSE